MSHAVNQAGAPQLANWVAVYGTPDQQLQAKLEEARKVEEDMNHKLGMSNAAIQMIQKSLNEGISVRDGDKTFDNWEDFKAHRIQEMARQKTFQEEQREHFNALMRASLSKRFQ